jgi:hypothetical protein
MERDLMAEAAATALSSNRVNRRLAFVRWVRRTHGWFGLWGALLGLMAGTSGIWLNHRSVMKLELPDQQQTNTQLAIPDPRPETANAMAAWLQQTLTVDRPATNVRVERSRPVPWAERGGEGRPPMQPERWTFVFGGPNKVMQSNTGSAIAGLACAPRRTASSPRSPTCTRARPCRHPGCC